ncbi:MAG: hypothetical protein Q4E61_00995 [Alphaproteobacteria bacterium]|nr:hypothetical protein [Alphaproteobacteria bacterium]
MLFEVIAKHIKDTNIFNNPNFLSICLSNKDIERAKYKQTNIVEIIEHNINDVLQNENESLHDKLPIENQLSSIFLHLKNINITKYINEKQAPNFSILKRLKMLPEIPLENKIIKGISSNIF